MTKTKTIPLAEYIEDRFRQVFYSRGKDKAFRASLLQLSEIIKETTEVLENAGVADTQVPGFKFKT